MKAKKKKDEIVYRIIDSNTGKAQGSYSRAYHDVYDFDSVYGARRDNCHGMFMDEDKYKIAKYKVTYELIQEDCDVARKHKKYYNEEKPKKPTKQQKELNDMFYNYIFNNVI